MCFGGSVLSAFFCFLVLVGTSTGTVRTGAYVQYPSLRLVSGVRGDSIRNSAPFAEETQLVFT